MQWFERFGYEHNPFELNPFKSQYTLINHVKMMDDIMYLVRAGKMFVIQGEAGCGKTMFLKQIVEKFGGKGKIVYLDAKKLKSEPDIEAVLNKQGQAILSFLRRKPKDMILLLDNVESLSARNCEKIKYYYDRGYLHAVVFTTTNYTTLRVSQSIKDRIMDQVVQIPPLNQFEAQRIVRERFADHFFLSDDVILKIFKLSQYNIKATLQHCNDVCQYVVKEGRGEVLAKYLPIVLKIKKSKKQPKESEQVIESTESQIVSQAQ
ncbi:MAG TPA: ATP-binding protein [Acidobacteriota bacterium]|nr:ATP-binding protein [Acidobacteriota bacterium]